MKHLEAVAKQAFDAPEKAAQQKTTAKPVQQKQQPAKQADQGIER
jgi:hypothetical protein